KLAKANFKVHILKEQEERDIL
ncbi:MAG: hypothetical protein K0R00_3111, partial [Herbinix sp.]|nr:hypothetical protein [Herbinix sp.]